MRFEHHLFAVVMFASCLGCVRGASNQKLVERASFDFNCPPQQIQVVELDSQTRGVRACGQQATYVEACDGPKGGLGTKCTWVLNTDSRPAGQGR